MEDKIRIMFVDDEPYILRMVQRVLRNEPWELEFYGDAEAAWEAIQQNPVDILIADQRMDGLSGIELLARVKEKYPDTLRIIFSGYTEVTTLTEAINKGHIYKFIHKPLKEEDLKLAIRRAVENVQLIRENRRLAAQIQLQNEKLQKLNEELEVRIEQRTRDLYLRQKALETAQAILENLPTAVLGISTDGSVVYSNTAASQLLRIPQGRLLAQEYRQVLPEPLCHLVSLSMKDQHQHSWTGLLNQHPVFARTTTFTKESGTGGIILSIIKAYFEAEITDSESHSQLLPESEK